MSKNNDNGISLATPPAIHVGPIVTPGTNETISIVIPLSAQLATVPGRKVDSSCKDCNKNTKQQPQQQQQQRPVNGNPTRIRNDKTKGCPFPTCSRYGRAFSRAHDLKRHIARHEMRKERFNDLELNDNIIQENPLIQRNGCPVKLEELRETDSKLYSCPRCKKKYSHESKLKAHLSTHEKASNQCSNPCSLCGATFQSDEDAQEHTKQHINVLQTQVTLEKSETTDTKDSADKDDDFLLEEMLLLNKNPRRSSDKTNGNAGCSPSKIRCDYCSKTFKTKWTLSSHVAAHEGRFQFDCAQCGKKFVRKSHYEGHVRSHEAARPYVCEQCGKTFKELKHRREHTKRKHSGNQNAIQNLLDSIGPCSSEEISSDQAKFTLFMPVNFTA